MKKLFGQNVRVGEEFSVDHRIKVTRARSKDITKILQIVYCSVRVPLDRSRSEVERILGAENSFAVICTLDKRPVGFVSGVILQDWFSNVVRNSPTPFFHKQLAAIDGLKFPNEHDLGRANATSGLDMFLSHFSVDQSLELQDRSRVYSLMSHYFVDHYAGNKINSILLETVGKENADRARNSGFRVLRDYPDHFLNHDSPLDEISTLFEMTLVEADNASNQHFVKLLTYKRPRFLFSKAHRDVLKLSHLGLSDWQIARELNISKPGVSSRWTRIFEAVEAVDDKFFKQTTTQVKKHSREAVLSYISQNLEEIWPFDPSFVS